MIWPAGDSPRKTSLAIVVMLPAGYLAGEIMGHPSWIGLSMLMMVSMLHRYFLPTRCYIDASGVRVIHGGTVRHLSWMRIRRFVYDHHGGILDTRTVDARFSRSRLQLMFPAEHAQIVESIRTGLKLFASPDVVVRELRENAG